MSTEADMYRDRLAREASIRNEGRKAMARLQELVPWLWLTGVVAVVLVVGRVVVARRGAARKRQALAMDEERMRGRR